jgi:hypothetical protein
MLRNKSPSILIPIHVNTCHWVALVRRSINNTVYFLYSNDINLHNVRDTIRYSYSRERTSDLFHPPDAVWINFNSFTYSPHTNECGPRSILALTVLSCHPNPSENILLPLMDDNIAQLCRWWIAECLIDETVDITPFARQYSTTIPYPTTTWTRSSHPFNIANLTTEEPTHLFKPDSYSSQADSDSTLSPKSLTEDPISTPDTTMTSNHVPLIQNTQKSPPDTTSEIPHAKPNKQATQTKLTNWTCHRPFIPHVSFTENTHHQVPSHPNQFSHSIWNTSPYY